MRPGAGKLQVIFACIFSRPTARNLTRLNACGSWFGAAVFTTATLQPWMTSSLLLNLYSKFGPAQTLRCNVSVGFFNIMQLFMSLCLAHGVSRGFRGSNTSSPGGASENKSHSVTRLRGLRVTE